MTPRMVSGAVWEMIDAVDWYEQQLPGLGTRFRSEYDQLVTAVCVHPRMFARVARAPRGRDVRMAKVPRFPFVVHYEVTATEIVILSVVHGRSRSRPWRRRLNTP